MTGSVRGERPGRGAFAALAWLLVGVAGLGGCKVPNFDGPQIQSPPRGFLLQPDSYLGRRMFPQREVVFHNAWVESVADFSTIFINGHPGVLTLEDVLAAQDSVRFYTTDPDVAFGGVEPLRIDGRDAWGWAERVESPSRGLESVTYRAVVPYDTITYAIEFYSGEPGLKSAAPDTLRAIVSSFAVGRIEWNLLLIAIMLGLVLLGGKTLWSRAQARAARLQSINLVTFKKEDEEEGASAEDEASVHATGPPESDSPQ